MTQSLGKVVVHGSKLCEQALHHNHDCSHLTSEPLQVLFCKLCQDQRDMYRAYLNSQEVDAIFAGNRTALAGIDILRKICNHPDLIERSKWEGSDLYGKPERSGKLTVAMKVGIHCPVAVFSASVSYLAVPLAYSLNQTEESGYILSLNEHCTVICWCLSGCILSLGTTQMYVCICVCVTLRLLRCCQLKAIEGC